MQQIYTEEPSYWPHGLKTDQFNGGLFLVQKSASAEPVGFVGWQKFNEEGRKVGYYAIGILPQHREQGFAKQAVARVISEIGRQCDEVKAMVMAHNEPSKALARSLRIPVLEKMAAMEKSGGLKLLGSLASGLGTASLLDLAVNKDKGAIGAYGLKDPKADKWSGADFLLNFLAGAAAPYIPNAAGRAALIGGAAAKTVATPAVRNQARGNDIMEQLKDKIPAAAPGPDGKPAPAKNWVESVPKEVWMGAGGLGLGALGVALFNAKKNREVKEQEIAEGSKGRVKITLPTKQPGDNETQVELPFDDLNLSKALRGRLGRDTRRRLHQETKQRTKRRKPKNPDKPTAAEQEMIDLEKEREELDKAASLMSLIDELRPPFWKSAMAPPPSVPQPPQLGQNPAMRMNPAQQMMQQKATANSIQPSTDANPQIMEAQQAAAQAEQQGQQAVAQAEQQAQQTAMQQQADSQQQQMKAEQEKEILKIQLEKEKATRELEAAKAKGAESAGKEGDTAVQRLTSSRIERIKSRVKTKRAALGLGDEPLADTGAAGPLDPATGQTAPPKGIVRPSLNAGQRYNQSGGLFQAPISLYRHSYGPVGDWFYDFLLRKNMMTPKPQAPMSMDRNSWINTPDKMGMINALYQRGAQMAMPQLS